MTAASGRLQIKAGSSAEDRGNAPLRKPVHRPFRVLSVIGGAVRGVRRNEIKQVMGNARPLRLRWLGGADIHVAVDLHRVASHDLAAKAFGQPKRKRRLARGGRTDQGDRADAFFVVKFFCHQFFSKKLRTSSASGTEAASPTRETVRAAAAAA